MRKFLFNLKIQLLFKDNNGKKSESIHISTMHQKKGDMLWRFVEYICKATWGITKEHILLLFIIESLLRGQVCARVWLMVLFSICWYTLRPAAIVCPWHIRWGQRGNHLWCNQECPCGPIDIKANSSLMLQTKNTPSLSGQINYVPITPIIRGGVFLIFYAVYLT